MKSVVNRKRARTPSARSSSARSSSARTSADDWLDEGLRLLREGGEAAVTIEALCARLERTKGAYYHHFEDVAAYLDRLLAHWAKRQTQMPIDVAEGGRTPAERRARLEETVRALDMKLERAVRAWSLRDPRARAVVKTVDSQRMSYLAQLHAAADEERKRSPIGLPPVREAPPRASPAVRARLEYAAFVGAQQIFPDLGVAEAREAEAALDAALTWLGD